MIGKFKTGAFFVMLFLAFSPKAFSQIRDEKVTKTDTTIVEDAKEAVQDNIPVISISEESDNVDGTAQNVSSQLTAGRDPYYNAAVYNFGAVRFRLRGYDADNFGTYMNGVPMENLDNGFTPYGLWGGLNDVMRNRENTLGLRAVTFAYGDLGGTTSYDTRASHQRKQTNISYAVSNRQYVHKFAFTHSTGMSKKGWAFSFSGSRRWADEGFTDGTYYDGWSAFLAVDKRINDRNLLSLVAFVTPTQSGGQGASTQEMIDIAGSHYYNPYWGYQMGKKRNANVTKSTQPIIILTHDWKINSRTSVLTAASGSFGKRSRTGIDWYNASDPRPDYYRYLPSYQLTPEMDSTVLDALKTDVNLRQINWDRLYNINYNSSDTAYNLNGVAGNNQVGRSHYIIQNRVVDTRKINVSTTINSSIASHIDFSAGANFQMQNNNYYKEISDLLGGKFYVDVNQFAERDFVGNNNASQNDLKNPNRVLYVGDKFGYDYNINILKTSAWVQSVFKFKVIDFFLAAEHSYTSFYRKGYMQNGLFPDNSLGKSTTYNFYNYSFKGGITYKINGKNYLYANSSYSTKAPFFENVYISPSTRDFVQSNLKSERITSVEGGYVLNAPKAKVRLTGFYTKFENGMDLLTAYSDVDRTFVNYALSNIGKEHAGVEIGVEAKLYKGLSINGAANIARYYYNTRQLMTTTKDNTTAVVSQNETVYTNNFRVATPQEAYTVGFNYRSPKFWFVTLNYNYFDQMWLSFAQPRRTYDAVNGIDPNSKLWSEVLDQTRLSGQSTVDLFAGYSWLMNRQFKSMSKRHFLVFNVGINNLLNNTDIISGGYEQLRFDGSQANKFPPKLFYAYGVNFFASVALRF